MRQLKSILFKLIVILIGASILFSFRFTEQSKTQILKPVPVSIDLKHASFQILQAKCNVCHEKKNPRRVFTLDNMTDLAPKIYKQVFIKKRMPKGNDIRLTDEEYDILKKWLFTTKTI